MKAEVIRADGTILSIREYPELPAVGDDLCHDGSAGSEAMLYTVYRREWRGRAEQADPDLPDVRVFVHESTRNEEWPA